MYFPYAEAKPTEKKKLSEKIKEKENLQRQKQEELRKQVSRHNNNLLILSKFNSHCGTLVIYFLLSLLNLIFIWFQSLE